MNNLIEELKYNKNTYLCTHVATRIQVRHNDWYVINLYTKKEYKISPLVSSIIISFIGEETIANTYSKISKLYSLSYEDYINLIDHLHKIDILVDKHNPSHIWSRKLLVSWNKAYWRKAADYQLLTYNYPFLDYRQEGKTIDIKLMKQFSSAEEDSNRGKSYTNPLASVNTPSTIEALKEFDIPFNSRNDTRLDKETILNILSSTFGVLRKRKLSKDGKRKEAVRKTVPSGGSRHPSEAYMFNLGIDGLERGIYHFSSLNYTMDKIRELPEEDQIELMFPGPFRAPFTPKAIFVVTSFFERNMYRYREPRTLRTIYMDVGHIVENINIIGQHLGINIYPHQGINENLVEDAIGINYLEEGAIIGIAVGEKTYEK